MKHISFADKALFVDDETADCIVEYASLLGAEQTADSVRVRAIGGDGNEVEADLVLTASTNLIAESTNSTLQTPRNEAAVAYMRERIELLRSGQRAFPSISPTRSRWTSPSRQNLRMSSRFDVGLQPQEVQQPMEVDKST